jgi:serine protease Do
MNTFRRFVGLSAFAALSLSALLRAETRPALPPAPPPPSAAPLEERELNHTDRLIYTVTGEHGALPSNAPVTFLGIHSAPVPPVLVEQLNLAKGVGLVVSRVMPGSPAESVLRQHDVLTKLNDQLLIEPRQLAVLVASFKEGDEVSFSIVRGGQPNVVKVKLGKRTPPPLTYRVEHYAPGTPVTVEEKRHLENVAREVRQRRESHLNEERVRAPATFERRFVPSPLPSGPLTLEGSLSRLPVGPAVWRMNDPAGALELRQLEPRQFKLLAKNAKGDVLFEGPIGTEEQRRELPAGILERLEKNVPQLFRMPVTLPFDLTGGDPGC